MGLILISDVVVFESGGKVSAEEQVRYQLIFTSTMDKC